jgi:uncharacterized membrane protein YozB (DUF420 family)
VRRLLRLYPRRWRRRYGDEFAALLDDLAGAPHRWRLAVDVTRGAMDARLEGMARMNRLFKDPVVRRGVYDGLIISALTAVLVVLTNVVFPGGPDESDSDPEYLWQYLATLAVLALLFVAIGFRGRRTGRTIADGIKAAVAAGITVALAVTVTFLVMNNMFFRTVSQQHDKRVAFASSGWTSMRAYISVQQVKGLVILVPVGIVPGVTLGLIGAALAGRRATGTGGVAARPPSTT